MTRWIVDGMNVVGSRPTGWWRDRPRAMRELVHALEAFAAATGAELTVVFDGRPFELETDDRVSVQFANRRGRNAADDDIAALVEGDGDPGSLSVVTSDGDLARRVRDAGAAVLGAGEFRRRLDG
ncbi:MAG TPA: NYN domain-containing protein [Thermoleophilaceae bacterium]|nr:NYN domain-containing protein [Thermoleophilaceae bacterium]